MSIQDGAFVDYYELLGIEPSASKAQIRQSFLQKAKQHHPDVGGSTDSMQLLNKAYKTLTLPSPRAAYDLLHRFHTGKNEIEYRLIELETESSADNLSDDYIDWFLDTVYAEYSTASKSKLSLGKLVKKFF